MQCLRKILVSWNQSFRSLNDYVYLFITLPIFLACFSAHRGNDAFITQRAGVYWFLSACLGVWFLRKYGPFIAGFFVYCLVSVGYVALYRDNHFAYLGSSQIIVSRQSLLGAIILLSTWVIMSLEIIRKQTMDRLLLAFGLLICLWFLFARKLLYFDGPLMTFHMASVFLVLLIPLAFRTAPIYAFLFIPTVIAIRGFSGILALALLYWAMSFSRKMWICFKVYSCILIVAGLAMAEHVQSRLGPRIIVWKEAWKFFWSSEHHWLGFGAGTAYSLIPWKQEELGLVKKLGGVYSYLHNAPLQLLFELGIIGFVWGVAIYVYTLVKAYKRRDHWLVGWLVAFLSASLVMPIDRHDTFLFLTAFVLHQAWSNGKLST